MELADVTDSKSVGSNTVRVRPPPSAPKIIPRSTSGVLFLARRVREHATCGSCMDARWRSHKVGARTRRPKTTAIRQPRPTSTTTNRHSPAFWCSGRENPQLAGKAWMPYKMNAQSFARMRNQQSVHKRAKDARWRSHKAVMQGCIKTATQSRYARMHKDSHTKPLHDATAQMAVNAQMQRHKWLSMHRCSDPNDRKRKDA